MRKITITTSSFAGFDKRPVELLEENGFEVFLNPFGRTLRGNEIIELCKGSIGIIAGTELLDAKTLESLAQSANPESVLKVISRCGTGMDSVDLSAANKLGIKVFNTPDAPTLAVAELTLGLILNLLRNISQMDRDVRKGHWKKNMGNLLSGKKIGIIGFGRIGQKVAEFLLPFDCKVKYYDVKNEAAGHRIKEGIKRAELDELLTTSDIISIHVSAKEGFIGEEEIKKIKKGACLINVSRGGVIDEDALYSALKDGHLTAAALDVFEQEPYLGSLRELDNVILTPHIGSYAVETRVDMEKEAVINLLKGLR